MTGTRLGTATLALAVILAVATGAWADYEAGVAASEQDRHAEAREEWLAAAEVGDSRAMLALGRLYAAGVGAPQDYVEAHMWLNLAAGFGEPEAAEERDTLAQEMTVEERAEARKLAREWRSSLPPASLTAGEADRREKTATVAPLSAGALREVQALLATLGYEPGPADGIWGSRSEKAYREFARDAGLEVGDEPTAEAIEVLRAIAEQYDADAPVTSPPAEDLPAVAAVPVDAALQAARAGDIEGLAAALEGGSDPNARDAKGWTALMHAANEGYVLLIPTLLEAGVDVDARAADGATALFIAALHGDATIVSALMRAGADFSVRGSRGKTAVDVARTIWGEPGDAEQNGADTAIMALLQGRTLGEEVTSQASVPKPQCKEGGGRGECWFKFANRTNCHFWLTSYDTNAKKPKYRVDHKSATWSGNCSHGKASGAGIGSHRNSQAGRFYEHEFQGAFLDGKRHGDWTYSGDGYITELTFVEGLLHGIAYTKGPNEYSRQRSFVGGKIHGRDVTRHSDGTCTTWIWDSGEVIKKEKARRCF